MCLYSVTTIVNIRRFFLKYFSSKGFVHVIFSYIISSFRRCLYHEAGGISCFQALHLFISSWTPTSCTVVTPRHPSIHQAHFSLHDSYKSLFRRTHFRLFITCIARMFTVSYCRVYNTVLLHVNLYIASYVTVNMMKLNCPLLHACKGSEFLPCIFILFYCVSNTQL